MRSSNDLPPQTANDISVGCLTPPQPYRLITHHNIPIRHTRPSTHRIFQPSSGRPPDTYFTRNATQLTPPRPLNYTLVKGSDLQDSLPTYVYV